MNKITKFWNGNKDTIKNVIIGITVPLLALYVVGNININKTIVENHLEDTFYKIEDEEEA